MKKNLLGISLVTITCLYGMLSAFIILVFIIVDLPVMYGIYLSIAILIIQFLISPFITDLTMKWFYGARFDYEIPDNIRNFIQNVCNKYNMKYPRVGFIDDGAPNAFTYGHTKNDARIVITRGILELLNEDEAISVISHELGHAKHYDTLFITFAQLVPLVLYGIYEMFVDYESDDDNNLQLVGYIAYVLYVISQFIVLKLSRTREYFADDFAIEETKNPNALAEALVKIGFGLSTNTQGKKHKMGANCLGIFDSKTSKSLVVNGYDDGKVSKENIKNAMKWEMWNVWAKIYEIKSTHPLISKRLQAITARCQEFNQEPYINFDLTKPESYVDDFAYEILLWLLPYIIIILTFILIFSFEDNYPLILGIGLLLLTSTLFIRLNISHKNKDYKNCQVIDLLGEVKVSEITCVPCIIKGNIIGRGNPGCILNEDFVLKDDSGIMLLDYNQPLNIINKLFAIFRSKEYFDKEVTIKGW